MSLVISINTGTLDAELGTTGTTWTTFSSGNDKLIFTAGSPTVASGQDTPTEAELVSAGTILTGSEIIVDRDVNGARGILLRALSVAPTDIRCVSCG
jgi:hypothetical protein